MSRLFLFILCCANLTWGMEHNKPAKQEQFIGSVLRQFEASFLPFKIKQRADSHTKRFYESLALSGICALVCASSTCLLSSCPDSIVCDKLSILSGAGMLMFSANAKHHWDTAQELKESLQ